LQKKEGSEEESIADRILAYTKKVKETGEFVSGSDQKKSPESLIEKSLAAEKSGKEKPEEKISEEPQPKEKEVKTPLVSSEETKDTDKIIEEVNKDISEIGDPKSEFEDVAKAEDDITKLSKEFATGALHAGYEIKVSPSEKGSEGHQKEKPDGGEKGTEGIVEKIGLPKKMKLSGWLRALEEGKELAHEESDKPVVTKASMEAIIDKFLDEEPRISKPQKNFFSPVNMAKQSITDDENLVTETLARIYEKQGNYSKAIRTYEILALKYPEKSSYFASLILELKSKNE
jgi:transposase-like protein